MNYEELLEKARETYESEDTPHVVKAWLLANIIYPADESEDERIRKALIELVKYAKGNCLELLHKPFNVVSMDAMLAWLEKQGEQTHVELGQSEVTKTSDQELESKKLDADEVIAWIVANILDYEYFVEWFKKDFEL